MSTFQQQFRDNAVYAYGYLQGRFSFLNHPSQLYGLAVSKITSLLMLPLPLLSFVAVPFLGGSSTTFNVVFFYLAWTALVASHDQLTVELYGTLLVRLLFFLLPAYGFLAFDCLVPNVSKSIKARGKSQLPHRLGRKKLLEVVGVATVNVLLSVALQGGLELFVTQVLHLRSILKVTTIVPLPWTIIKDVASGFAIRGALRYFVHRFFLHTYASPLKTWHIRWQHSVRLPFSLVAAYDHPINHLMSQWVPVFLPAYIFRFHVLTWHILLAIVSLEELFVYSGYAVLPSSIILAGMARRTDAHFESVQDGRHVGNFGHMGLLDFVCGTTCKGEDDVVDDIQDEAEKHNLQQRARDAVKGAVAGIRGKQKRDDQSSGRETNKRHEQDEGRTDVESHETSGSVNQEIGTAANTGADENADGTSSQPGPRRSGRRKDRKA